MLKIDTLFNLLGVLLFFIVTLLAQVNPAAEADPLDPPGNLVASIAWPAGRIDVDLWVAHGDEPVGYSQKSGRVWSLLRDDLGTANDNTPLNFESAFTRGLPDGEYVVNVKCYGCAGAVPVPVSVEVRLAEGPMVFRGVVSLVKDKQERTAIRFRVRDGKVVVGSESSVFKPLSNGGK
ncbi:hypothetical protein IB276_26340 [Ensifer sp. ENS04]|uniref:hypothetical protein n=1 Tax=Ensifer sp. ENS04 TaxID=2769281 RepID=UPI00177F11E0|nr:hypothetical protein [Ensifer sp. ENS04]MBD9542969.1 hypothetical protein [Ensifer sp. ENS04]